MLLPSVLKCSPSLCINNWLLICLDRTTGICHKFHLIWWTSIDVFHRLQIFINELWLEFVLDKVFISLSLVFRMENILIMVTSSLWTLTLLARLLMKSALRWAIILNIHSFYYNLKSNIFKIKKFEFNYSNIDKNYIRY